MTRLTILSLCILTTACASGEVRDTLGLNRKAPDEFTVVSRPPLSVPPEFYLRPPQPGAQDLGVTSLEQQARDAILVPDSNTTNQLSSDLYEPTVETAVTPVISTSLSTSGESVFLDRAGTNNADPNIRKKLYRETQIEPVEKLEDTRSPLERWLGIDEDRSSVIDAPKEAQRIRTNKDAGRPITEGEVPTENSSDKSILERMF